MIDVVGEVIGTTVFFGMLIIPMCAQIVLTFIMTVREVVFVSY